MKVYSIQFLRGIAAILVVYTHSLQLQMEYSVSAQQNFYHLKHFGCIGVDLFFVISGFIIMFVANQYSGISHGIQFIAKRFLRINPVYYIASLTFLALLVIEKWLINEFSNIPIHRVLNAFSDTIFIMPVSGDFNVYKPLLIVGWTLSFEWLFYTIFFLIILFRIKNKALFSLIVISSIVTAGIFYKLPDYRYVFATNPILLEFLLGVIIFWIYNKLNHIPSLWAYACLSLGLIGYGILIIVGYDYVWSYLMVLKSELSFQRFLFWGIPSALIVAGCVFLEKDSKLKSIWQNKLFSLMGEASYSIYLVNPIVFFWLSFLYKRTGILLQADLTVIIQLAVTILISFCFYKLVEKPIINIGYRIMSSNLYTISRNPVKSVKLETEPLSNIG